MNRRPVYVIGHRNPDADSVGSAIAYAHLARALGRGDVRAARAGELDAETAFALETFGVSAPELVTDATGLDLVLVDHNEVSQAVAHVQEANILEIWEHHRLGDLRPAKPLVFHCEPVGATATLIAEQYRTHQVEPPRAIAGVLLAAIYSDTVLFRSPTTKDEDRRAATWLERIARVDRSFGEQMLLRRTAAGRKSAAEIVRGDTKEFRFGRERVGIAQVEVMGARVLDDRRASVLREMRRLREEAGLTQMILMITDVEGRASELWFVGARREVFERALGRLHDDRLLLPGCMSRKSQVVPPLEAAFTAADAASFGIAAAPVA